MTISRISTVAAVCAVLCITAGAAQGFPLLSPSQDQIVREKVRITIPYSALQAGIAPRDSVAVAGKEPFVAIHLDDGTNKYFVSAASLNCGTVKSGKFTIYWDTKAPFRDPKDPKHDKHYKDGNYTLRLNIHSYESKLIDSATVRIQLRNKVPRSNPAPGISLVNRLSYGESCAYNVHADVQVFEMVSGVGLPILGGLGMTSDFKVVQTVDDVRADGTYLLRYRIAKGAQVSSFGRRRLLYDNDEFGPQLYRLVTKLGKVVKTNVFARQAHYTITDVLPTLPANPVKEGDSWPCAMTLKIEGITHPIKFTGTSMLDSFEWQDGRECAKILSDLTGTGVISMGGGKIRSEANKVGARVVTYFSYRSGTAFRNEITMDFDALILPGAGEPGEEAAPERQGPSPGTAMPMDEEDEVFQRGPRPAPTQPGGPTGSSGSGLPEGAKKGSVQVKVVYRLEK